VDQFPSNSHNPVNAEVRKGEKPEEKVVTKIVSGRVTRKKKPLGARFREMFFPHAEVSVVEYVVGEILVPALKDMMTDAVSEGFARMLNGGEGRASRRRPGTGGAFSSPSNRVNYSSYSSPSRREERPSRRTRESDDFNDIVLETRRDAERVIDTLITYVGNYQVATVADLFELVGEPSHHTDQKWGWTNLDTAGIRRINSNSYQLVLPKPEFID
jgi:hypothetical protein